MLDVGFPVGSKGGNDGCMALHAAAYAGSADVVRLLIERGADLESLDERWQSTPVVWAVIGSGAQPPDNPVPDWLATIRSLIAAGASLSGVTLGPDDPKPPSPAIAELLAAHGVR